MECLFFESICSLTLLDGIVPLPSLQVFESVHDSTRLPFLVIQSDVIFSLSAPGPIRLVCFAVKWVGDLVSCFQTATWVFHRVVTLAHHLQILCPQTVYPVLVEFRI